MSATYAAYLESLRSYASDLTTRYRHILGDRARSLSFAFTESPTYEGAMRAYDRAKQLYSTVMAALLRPGPGSRFVSFYPVQSRDGSTKYVNLAGGGFEQVEIVRTAGGAPAFNMETKYFDPLDFFENRRAGHVIKELAVDGDLYSERRRAA